ncbi:MAG TPA: 30S ribosomal protein S13 [Patescibacteria group bacterium]|nr:30S ribosomal protein S13 [Patescibacteria group bacterium]
MARLAGIEMNDNLRLAYALTRINGIGWSKSEEIMKALKMDESKRLKDLGPDDFSVITTKLDEYTTEGDLVRQIRGNIARLREIGTYRGTRHAKALPVRGQRTRTNARTKRGKRKTVGAFKKEVLTKMDTTAKEDANAKK